MNKFSNTITVMRDFFIIKNVLIFSSILFHQSIFSGQSMAQTPALSFNDKTHKAYAPYRQAIKERFGSSSEIFKAYLSEKRLICDWNLKKIDCGYIEFANDFDEYSKQQLVAVLLNPCLYMHAKQASNKAETLDQPTGETNQKILELKKEGIMQSEKAIRNLCNSGFFKGQEVRQIKPHSFAKKEEPRTLIKTKIAFEIRINN